MIFYLKFCYFVLYNLYTTMITTKPKKNDIRYNDILLVINWFLIQLIYVLNIKFYFMIRSPSSTDHCARNHLSHYLIATSPLSFPLGEFPFFYFSKLVYLNFHCNPKFLLFDFFPLDFLQVVTHEGVIYFLDRNEGVMLKQAKKLKFVCFLAHGEEDLYI
jgi:hypothetical protein